MTPVQKVQRAANGGPVLTRVQTGYHHNRGSLCPGVLGVPVICPRHLSTVITGVAPLQRPVVQTSFLIPLFRTVTWFPSWFWK